MVNVDYSSCEESNYSDDTVFWDEIEEDEFFHGIQNMKFYIQDRCFQFRFLNNYSTLTLIDTLECFCYKDFMSYPELDDQTIEIMKTIILVILGKEQDIISGDDDLKSLYYQLKYANDYGERYSSFRDVEVSSPIRI